jgi:hypothetical protein
VAVTPISEIEKRGALSGVLASRTFSRCRQLRRFLRYIADTEIAGGGAELTEYSVAVEALGRPLDFSPCVDAIVRNRAHLLRNKLETYYTEENPGASLRLELPKGSYCPVFREAEPSAAEIAFHGLARGLEPKKSSVLCEAWGALATASGNPLICIATPAHLMVRPDPVRIPDGDPGDPAAHLLDWYHRLPSLPRTEELFLRPAVTSVLWGDCAAALTVSRLLVSEGATPEVVQEAAISIPMMRNRNVVLIGRAEYSKAVEHLMRDAPFQVVFRPECEESIVVNLEPRNREPTAYGPKFAPDNHLDTVYGLITVMPSKSTDPGQQRTVILSGTISPGAQAAAEFLSSEKSLAQFKELLQREGEKRFPDAYQIVVKAQVHLTMVLEVSYVTHRVLASGR